MAVMEEFGDRRRGHADAKFVVLDFLGNADEHGCASLNPIGNHGAFAPHREDGLAGAAFLPHAGAVAAGRGARLGDNGSAAVDRAAEPDL